LREKLNVHLISLGDGDDLKAQSNVILPGLSLIYEAGAAMIYVFGYRRSRELNLLDKL
jgi:outer membrane receptor for Fe3+-dicitrate